MPAIWYKTRWFKPLIMGHCSTINPGQKQKKTKEAKLQNFEYA